MRLVAFHAVNALRSDMVFNIVLPEALEQISRFAFGSRLRISSKRRSDTIVYSVRGMRELLPLSLCGQKFAAPYGRVVIKNWSRWNFRDRVNCFLFWLADLIGLVYSPPWESLMGYQGYSEVLLIPQLRDICSAEFHAQVSADYDLITDRVVAFSQKFGGRTTEISADTVLVFPTGTGRQFVPVNWAQKNLPEAVFAIHERDAELGRWQSSGLKTITYSTPGEIAAMGGAAAMTITTDSFPSHILQYSGGNILVLITGTERSRVVSPGFKGQVVDAVAPCHPCPHLERQAFPKCKEGFRACLNWESPEYTEKIMKLVKIMRSKALK